MRWQSIATRLADRAPPLMLLDSGGRVRLANSALRATFGRTSREAQGVECTWVCRIGKSYRRRVRRCVKDALRGKTTQCQCTGEAQSGERLDLQLDMTRIGGVRNPAVLVLVKVLRPAASPDRNPLPDGAYGADYVVSNEARFGELREARVLGGASTRPQLGTLCYRELYARHEPCSKCPLLATSEQPWPRIAAWPSETGREALVITTASPAADRTFRMSSRVLSDSAVISLVRARMSMLAERAALSDRELSVLERLVEGDSQEDIAAALGITARTVKFHQRNLLHKLHAESRVDLLRVLLN